MAFLTFFLGFSGRIGRAQWWYGMLGIAFTIAVMFAIVIWSDHPLLAVPLVLFVFVSVYALAVKRLHDRGRSGFWSLVFIFLPGVIDRISDRLTDHGALWWVLAVLSLALGLWGLLELGVLRGTDGNNDYGPDPLAQREPIGEPEATR
ncbi:MAG: DUF805 domain-containing protein [Pseudorhodoplanes sp.]|uniref:DUF805 domain-containing protein n=1 Tax=Pseudorhodoplanes sp. TaxID=1934341 RepID=UPI003D0FDBCF